MNRSIEVVRTIYPRLPDIPNQHTLTYLTTLESKERAFIDKAKTPRIRYLRALYLKGLHYFGHSRFSPGDLPRPMRLKMTEELGEDKSLADILKINPAEKSKVVIKVREFTGFKRYFRVDRSIVESHLVQGVAAEEGNLLPIANATIQWFRNQFIELPEFGFIMNIAERALSISNTNIQDRLFKRLDLKTQNKLDSLLDSGAGPSPFEHLKGDAKKPTPITIQAELERVRQTFVYIPEIHMLKELSRRKVEEFAEIGKQYTAAELGQLNDPARMTILMCFLKIRRAQLLDPISLMAWR